MNENAPDGIGDALRRLRRRGGDDDRARDRRVRRGVDDAAAQRAGRSGLDRLSRHDARSAKDDRAATAFLIKKSAFKLAE